TLFPYTTLFRSAKGTTRVSARSCGAVRFGRPPTSQAVAAVHPSRSSASTSNSSRRHTHRPKDAYGVPAILPRPEGRDLPRTGSRSWCTVVSGGVLRGGFRRIMAGGVRLVWDAGLSSLRAVAWFDTLLVWVLVAVFRMVRNVACPGSCGRVSNRSRCRLSGFLRGRSEPGGAAKRSRPFGLPSPPAPDRAAAELARFA